MKKIKRLFVLLISAILFSPNVFAASATLSVGSNSVTVGDNFTVSVHMSSAAAWNIHVTASGPVSGCVINQANATDDAMDTSNTFSATCTATGEGTIYLTLSGDVTSASDGLAVSISGNSSVTVTKKETPPDNNANNNTNNNNSSNSNTNGSTNNNATDPVNNKSTNNNIKELVVDGYELVKVDENHYTLSVSNHVTSINIKATVEDSKATITGDGVHEVKVGENDFEVIVTSESGEQNKINIKVTRKDAYYLDDLETLLKDNKIKDINININSDTKLGSSDLTKIKASGKTVQFNYYNEDKKLIYSWSIDGTKIQNTSEFSTSVLYQSEYKKEISKLSNYADGLYISFLNNTKLPGNIKLRLNVLDKYENGDSINFYIYNKDSNTLELVKENIIAKDGYIEFEIEQASDYLITMSNIMNVDKVAVNSENSSLKLVTLIILIVVFIILLLVRFFFMKKIHKKCKSNIGEESLEEYFRKENISDISMNNTIDQNMNFNDENKNVTSNKQNPIFNSNDQDAINSSNNLDYHINSQNTTSNLNSQTLDNQTLNSQNNYNNQNHNIF